MMESKIRKLSAAEMRILLIDEAMRRNGALFPCSGRVPSETFQELDGRLYYYFNTGNDSTRTVSLNLETGLICQ